VALAELAGPVAPYRVAELGVDLAGALRSLHDAGLTHGNVSADTVLICEDGAAMLGGLLVGAAEELLCAELGGAVPRRVYEVRADLLGPKAERWALDGGPAADCWALGVLLYRLLTGRPPYPEGDVPTLLAAVGEGLPGLMEECGPLRPLVERLLRADPAARPTAAQVRQGLAELLASAPEPFGAQAAVLLPVRRPDGPLVPRPRAGEAEVHARHAGRRSLVPPALVGPLLVGGVLVALLLALAGVVALAG
jgi:serine/threonine protein kinase